MDSYQGDRAGDRAGGLKRFPQLQVKPLRPSFGQPVIQAQVQLFLLIQSDPEPSSVGVFLVLQVDVFQCGPDITHVREAHRSKPPEQRYPVFRL